MTTSWSFGKVPGLGIKESSVVKIAEFKSMEAGIHILVDDMKSLN